MRVSAALAILTLAWGAPAPAADDARLTCTAFAASTGGPRSAPVATTLDIVIDRYSPDADRKRLIEALKKSQDAMLDTLRDMPRLGYIRMPGSLGWDLHFAQSAAGEDGGRRIVIATDRPMPFWEVVNRPRSVDYPFTFIELRINPDGEGEGKLSVATQVTATSDGRFVQLENYATQPVQLNQVKCR